MFKAYEKVVDRILELLDEGTVPWQKTWSGFSSPRNLISTNKYKGINALLLGCAGYSSPYWMTYKQAGKVEGHVKQGAKGWPIIYYEIKPLSLYNYCKWLKIEKNSLTKHDWADIVGKGKNKKPIARLYYVFNIEEIEMDDSWVPKFDKKPDFDPVIKAENIIKRYIDAPAIHEVTSGGRAFYRPSTDIIKIPSRTQFSSEAEYYSTLFHECAHSTGHETRLNRNLKDMTGYAKEELVAEITACILSNEAGIMKKVENNSAAYIKSWKSKIKEDKQIIIKAARDAAKAADWINKPKEGDEWL
jgi:antirestriction protein ArdC